MSNKTELKTISRSALLSEVINKTSRCALLWNQTSPVRYACSSLPYEFYLTQTAPLVYVLDVHKDGRPYRAYNSTTQPEVAELYVAVDSALGNAQRFDRTRQLAAAVGRIRNGCTQSVDEFTTVRLLGGGSAPSAVLVRNSVFMLPGAMAFGPNGPTWTGSLSDIKDAPNATANDGDASFIRQPGGGVLGPTLWGYVVITFNNSRVPASGPYQITARVAHRREDVDGPMLNVDLTADGQVIFTDQTLCQPGYSIYSTGTVPSNLPSIANLQLRLSMYSNMGTPDPIAVRVTAVDITVVGYAVS